MSYFTADNKAIKIDSIELNRLSLKVQSNVLAQLTYESAGKCISIDAKKFKPVNDQQVAITRLNKVAAGGKCNFA